MGDRKVWTADELLALTPNERHAVVQAGIVADVEAVPSALLDRARADVAEHVARSGSRRPS